MKRYDMTRGRCGSGNQVKRGHSKIWREILVRDNDVLDTCSDCGASDLLDDGTLDTPGGKVGALNKISDVRHLLGMQVHQDNLLDIHAGVGCFHSTSTLMRWQRGYCKTLARYASASNLENMVCA